MALLPINGLYYITHTDNLSSILSHGILSHEMVQRQGIGFRPIYDTEIISDRQNILTPAGRSLWNYANLYLKPRNPMLFRVVQEKSHKDIAVVEVDASVLYRADVFITDGNARAGQSQIMPQEVGVARLPQIVKNLDVEYWKAEDGSKRRIMAECLIPDQVPPTLMRYQRLDVVWAV